MAKEMEAKVKIEDQVALEKLVVSLGGKQKYARKEVNIFYDTPQRKLDKRGEVLRLRQESYAYNYSPNYDCECGCHSDACKDVVSMTFKGKRAKGKLKIREEHEFNVSSFEQAQSLLLSLGHKEFFRFEKLRHSYIYKECLVEFDTLPYLGSFVEVEGTSESKINKVLKDLGLQDAKLITDGYGGLLWEDAKKHRRSKKLAVFPK